MARFNALYTPLAWEFESLIIKTSKMKDKTFELAERLADEALVKNHNEIVEDY